MSATLSLANFPKLLRWYLEQQTCSREHRTSGIAFEVCDALMRANLAGFRRWTVAFRQQLSESPRPLEEFLKAEAIFQGAEADLIGTIGAIGECLVTADRCQDFQASMRSAADVTGLIAFRFLSAWTALNAGALETCIEECEKVTEPFHSIHTLHGQALMESGRPLEAIDAFDVATVLQPQEIMTWFQKAKAHHLLGNYQRAYESLEVCHKLAPVSDEVVLYQLMIALESKSDDLWQRAWDDFTPRFERFSHDGPSSLRLLRLALLLKSKDKFNWALEKSTWDGHLEPGEITHALSTILRTLGDSGWMDAAQQLLSRVAPMQAG